MPIDSVIFPYLNIMYEIRILSIASYPIKITGGFFIPAGFLKKNLPNCFQNVYRRMKSTNS